MEENLNWSHILSIKTNTMQLHVVTYEGNLLSLFLQNCFKVEPKKALHYNGLTFSNFLLFNGIYIVQVTQFFMAFIAISTANSTLTSI